MVQHRRQAYEFGLVPEADELAEWLNIMKPEGLFHDKNTIGQKSIFVKVRIKSKMGTELPSWRLKHVVII